MRRLQAITLVLVFLSGAGALVGCSRSDTGYSQVNEYPVTGNPERSIFDDSEGRAGATGSAHGSTTGQSEVRGESGGINESTRVYQADRHENQAE